MKFRFGGRARALSGLPDGSTSRAREYSRGLASAAVAGSDTASAWAAQASTNSRLRMTLLQRQDLAGVKALHARSAVLEELPQGAGNRAERDFLPGNLAFAEEPHFQGLRSRREGTVEEPRAVEDMHLVNGRNGQQREHLAQVNARLRLFHRLPQRRLRRRLAELHESRG